MEYTSPTPVLDRQKPALAHAQSHPKRPSISNLFFLSLLGLLLVTVLVRIAAWALVCIIVHECGHLLAALAVGWEIRFFLAGPFAFTKESEGWRFRFLPRELLKGGRVFAVPKHSAGWSRAAAITVTLGGPVTTALLFMPVFILPRSGTTICLAIANSFVAAGSWIPARIGGWITDAKLVWHYAFTSPARFASVGRIWALDYQGVKPSDWPPELVEQLAVDPADPISTTLARRYRYLHNKYGNDSHQAAVALESVLECAPQLTPDQQFTYFCEAAFWQGAVNRNPIPAREWLADAEKLQIAHSDKDWRAYPLAAIAIAEGDVEQARALLDITMSLLDRAPGTGGGTLAAERERLQSLRQHLVNGVAVH